MNSEDVKEVVTSLYKYIEEELTPKLKEEIRFLVNQQVNSYVLIDSKNKNFIRDNKVCCITMAAFQGGNEFRGINTRTLRDLEDYLKYPPNFCPFCGAKL